MHPAVVKKVTGQFSVVHLGQTYEVELAVTGASIPHGLVDNLIYAVSSNFDATAQEAPAPVAKAVQGRWEEPEVTDAIEAEPPVAEPDDSIYGSFTKMKDLVLFLHLQGYTEFQSIFEACKDLISQDLCPMLTKVANLEARLKTTCAVNGIPV